MTTYEEGSRARLRPSDILAAELVEITDQRSKRKSKAWVTRIANSKPGTMVTIKNSRQSYSGVKPSD